MPRYDYRCEAGHRYEVMEPFGSPAVHSCRRCGKEARRVLVAPPLVFKGAGFYKTSGSASKYGSTGLDGNDSNGKDSTPTSSNRSRTPPKKESSTASADD